MNELDPNPDGDLKGENFFALFKLDSLRNDFALNYEWLKRLFKGPFDISDPTNIMLVKAAEGSLVNLKAEIDVLSQFITAYEYVPPTEGENE